MLPTLIFSGVVIILPLEILFLLICLTPFTYSYLEYRRCKKESFSIMGVLKPIVFFTVITIAYFIPKHEDWTVETAINNQISIQELSDQQIIKISPIDLLPKVQNIYLHLDTTEPTIRDILNAVETQTKMQVMRQRCGNGSTILFGPDRAPYIRIPYHAYVPN